MASPYLYTIIEDTHARLSELPTGNKDDSAVLKLLSEQISAAYTELKEKDEEAKRVMREKLDEATKHSRLRRDALHGAAVMRRLRRKKRASRMGKVRREIGYEVERGRVGEELGFGATEQEQEQADEVVREMVTEDAFESMGEARDETVREQVGSEERKMEEKIRQRVEAKQDAAISQQADEELKALRQEMEDEEIARRYADGNEVVEEEGEQEDEMNGVPLPNFPKRKEEKQESRGYETQCDPWKEQEGEELEGYSIDPWEVLHQEIVNEATRVEENEEEERRQNLKQQAEELEALRKKMDDDEIARRYFENEDAEVSGGVSLPRATKIEDVGVPLLSDAEIQKREKEEALRKQQDDIEALGQQSDDEKLTRRWYQGEEMEEEEGLSLPGGLKPEDMGIPSLPTEPPNSALTVESPEKDTLTTQRSNSSSSSDVSSTSETHSSDRSRTSTISTTTSTSAAVQPEMTTEALSSFRSTKTALDPNTTFPTIPFHGHKRPRSPHNAKQYFSKRKCSRAGSADPHTSTMSGPHHMLRGDLLEYWYRGA